MKPSAGPRRTSTPKPAAGPADRVGPSYAKPAAADRRAELADQFDRRASRASRFQRRQSAAGRDIGPIPPVVDQERREAARLDFRKFCETYARSTFSLAWSPDHLKMIGKIEAAVLRGELFAFAMPRGSGKTSLATAAATWALLYGHHGFVVVVGSDELASRRLLESVWCDLETSDELLADFPETCHPIRALERSTQRCRGQLCDGVATRITKTASEFTLPTISGSPSSAGTLRACGIGGGIRGLTHKRADGTTVRPTLALIDDPATDEVAGSPKQIQDRLDILRGAILGLAGPGRKIAGLAAITIIKPEDVADQLLDRTRNPSWQGEKAQLVYSWPTRDDLWDQYAELRREGQRSGGGVEAATEFYRSHRDAMDEGAVVGWPERKNDDELTALQHAYNLRIDRGEAAFQAEYQNAPISPTLQAAVLDAASLRSRAISLDRGVIPAGHSTLVASVDVQERLLFWMVTSWGGAFSGHVVAYGSYPDQPATVFTAAGAKRTLAQLHPGGGFEATLLAGLEALFGQLLTREWKREDDTRQRIEAVVIDANWGKSTGTIREFVRRHPNAGMLYPAHGKGITAAAAPLNEKRRAAGERLGPGWRIGTVGGQRGLTFDSNFWKTTVAARLNTAVGDPGSLTFHRGNHEMLIDHLLAEHPTTVEAKGRVVDQWSARPGSENHFLDTLVMGAVAASIAGIQAAGTEVTTRRRKKVEIPAAGERRKIEVRRWNS